MYIEKSPQKSAFTDTSTVEIENKNQEIAVKENQVKFIQNVLRL